MKQLKQKMPENGETTADRIEAVKQEGQSLFVRECIKKEAVFSCL